MITFKTYALFSWTLVFFKKIKLLTSINVNYYKIALIQILSVKIIYIKKKKKKRKKKKWKEKKFFYHW